jgi:peroxiredoxin
MSNEPEATLSVGDVAPDFTLRNQYGEQITLSSFQGERAVLLVFYPFAFSGICTGELCEIRDDLSAFENDDVQVLAISCDPMHALRAWAEDEKYSFPLLSDFWPHGATANAYGVFNPTTGSSVRATFLVGADGRLRWSVVNGMGEARDPNAYRDAIAAL